MWGWTTWHLGRMDLSCTIWGWRTRGWTTVGRIDRLPTPAHQRILHKVNILLDIHIHYFIMSSCPWLRKDICLCAPMLNRNHFTNMTANVRPLGQLGVSWHLGETARFQQAAHDDQNPTIRATRWLEKQRVLTSKKQCIALNKYITYLLLTFWFLLRMTLQATAAPTAAIAEFLGVIAWVSLL